MRIVLTSNELWEDLEVKSLKLADEIEFADSILADKCKVLVNHLNGNLARENQTSCIERIKGMVDVLSGKNYFDDRKKYNEASVKKVLDYKEDLAMFHKVLLSEQRELFKEARDKEKEPKEEKRLPNIKSEKVMELYKPIK